MGATVGTGTVSISLTVIIILAGTVCHIIKFCWKGDIYYSMSKSVPITSSWKVTLGTMMTDTVPMIFGSLCL